LGYGPYGPYWATLIIHMHVPAALITAASQWTCICVLWSPFGRHWGCLPLGCTASGFTAWVIPAVAVVAVAVVAAVVVVAVVGITT
jgi:hypothetical protein